MENNRCAIYARYSSLDVFIDNKKSRSIQNQIRILKEYALNQGFEIYKTYQDYHFSGKDFLRPGIQALLKDAINGEFNIVIVKDLSRFGRNYIEVGNYLDNIFPKYKIRFISVDDNFDSEANNDYLSIALKNFMNSYYIKDIAHKIRKTIVLKLETNALCNRKYGYIVTKDEFKIDPEASLIVKYIFEKARKNTSTRAIAKILNQKKILNPFSYFLFYHNKEKFANLNDEQKFNWRSSSINRILKDQVYLGRIINFKKSYIEQKSSLKRNVVINNHHENIISEETFNQVQHNINHDLYLEKRKTNLHHLCYCKSCLEHNRKKSQTSLSFFVRDNKEYYHCIYCKKEYPLEEFNQRVYDELIAKYKYIKHNTKNYIKSLLLEKTSVNSEGILLSAEIKLLEQDLKNLKQKHLNGLILNTEYQSKYIEYSTKIKEKTDSLNELNVDKLTEEDVIDEVNDFLSSFYQNENILMAIKDFVFLILYDFQSDSLDLILKLEDKLNIKSKKFKNLYKIKLPLKSQYNLHDLIYQIIKENQDIPFKNILNSLKKYSSFSLKSIKKTFYNLKQKGLIKLYGNNIKTAGYITTNYKDTYTYNNINPYLLTNIERNIFKLIYKNNKLEIKQIASTLNISLTYTRKCILHLKKLKVIDVTKNKQINYPKLFLKTLITDEEKKYIEKRIQENNLMSRKSLAKEINRSEKSITRIIASLGYKKELPNGHGRWIKITK